MRLRVLLVAPPWLPIPPPSYGGTELVIDGLARGLAAAGHDVCLFATGDSTCPVNTRWVYETAARERMSLTMPEMHHVIRAYAGARDFDVVHDHTLVGPLYGPTLPTTPPVVTTLHAPFSEELTSIYSAMSSRASLVAISHRQAATAPRDVAITGVIHHGIDTARYPSQPRANGYLAFLGRMSPNKGVHRAISLARQAGTPLRIAAKLQNTAELQYFETQVEPQLGGDVVYVGELAHDAKVELLGGARALLNPIAWDEPFGLAMVEALACGTPVIASPRGAAPELIDHHETGFLCQTDGEFLEAIHAAARLDRRACRHAAETRFSNERMVADYIRLFERLTNCDPVESAA